MASIEKFQNLEQIFSGGLAISCVCCEMTDLEGDCHGISSQI